MLVKENAKGGALIPIQRGEPIPRPRGSTFDLDCHLEPGRDPTVSISWWINGRRFRNKSRAKVRTMTKNSYFLLAWHSARCGGIHVQYTDTPWSFSNTLL